jgi:hypothetical protein
MQLSLPVSLPVSTDPLTPGAAPAAPAAGLGGSTATDQTDVPFENLLSDETPANAPATSKVGEEAETAAASILASAFWMAVGPLPPPMLPAMSTLASLPRMWLIPRSRFRYPRLLRLSSRE